MPTLSIVRSAALEIRRRTQRFSLSTQKRRDCKLGKKRRLVLLLACDTLLPDIGRLPVTLQTRAMVSLQTSKIIKRGLYHKKQFLFKLILNHAFDLQKNLSDCCLVKTLLRPSFSFFAMLSDGLYSGFQTKRNFLLLIQEASCFEIVNRAAPPKLAGRGLPPKWHWLPVAACGMPPYWSASVSASARPRLSGLPAGRSP